jgi:pimeloyl-ACP methyl ester carboxylesterase
MARARRLGGFADAPAMPPAAHSIRGDALQIEQEDAMTTNHATPGSTAAPARDGRGSALENPRERLLAGLAATERRLFLNGVETAVLEGGQGAPVVLLHGPGTYGAHWLDILPSLARTHHFVAPDLPGHGESGMFAVSADPALLSGWLDHLIERTCPAPPVLVGSTLGGAIAARFARDHGHRLAGLVLVDALGLTDFRPTAEFGATLNDYLSAPGPLTYDRLWDHCAFDVPALRTRLGQQWDLLKAYTLDRMGAPDRLAAMRSLMGQFGMTAIPPDLLSDIAVPTTLIWGREDRATPLAIAEEASRRLGWNLLVIDAAADDPALERPDAFMTALLAALPSSSAQ